MRSEAGMGGWATCRGESAPRHGGLGKARGLKRILAYLFVALCAQPLWPQAGLIFTDFPRSEVFQDSTVRIAIRRVPPPARTPDSCWLFRGPVAAGNTLEGHPTRLAAARSRAADSSLVLSFKPTDNDSGRSGPQLGLGFHYLVAYCDEGKLVTPEAPLWVVTGKSPSITSPKATETSSSPTLAWTPVPGVPAYHLLLSDQAIQIDADKGTVSGASIIWQAITTQTSIAYGTPDPSGTYAKLPAPPLSPNVPYNLVILNNYDGRSSLSTSAKAQGLKLFTIQPPGPALKPPKNLSPAPDTVLTVERDSAITFRWNRATAAAGSGGANTYQLFIYSLEAQDDLDVLIPIWRTEVTDTFAVVDAKRTLLTKRYVWKVFALSESGAGTVGDTTSFRYRNDVQTVSIAVRSSVGNAPVGDVRIAIAPQDGSADPLPLFTLDDGSASKVLAVGGYTLSFAKDGFLPASRSISLGLTAPLEVVQILTPASARITGRIVDGTGAQLVNATVTATGGGRTVTAVSDAQGYFLLGVAPGVYAVSFAKPDYQARPDTTVAAGAGATLDLGKLPLAQAQGSLTGTVANDKGAPLAGSEVTVKTPAGAAVRVLRTDDKGVFSAFLSPGTYTVTAARSGFTSGQKTVQLTEAASLAFILASGASLVKGRVNLLTWPQAGAPQTAPLAGATVELIDRLRNTSQKAETDLRGEYAFSADTGLYLLRATRPGRALPDSALAHLASQRSTYVIDISMQGFAAIKGTIRLSPDSTVNPSAVQVSLLNAATLAVVATATPQAAPEPGFEGALAYSLDAVPDGTYRLACGLAGYGLDTEPGIQIKDAQWKTGQDLTLKKANKTLGFAFTSGGKPVTGAVRLRTPQAVDLPVAEKLKPAPAGTYSLDAVPDSAHFIPLSRYTFSLPSAGAADTVIGLTFPFAHRPGALTLSDGQAELGLEALARLDSVQIIFGYGAPTDTFRVPASQLFGPVGPRTLRFKPGPEGGLLTYWFRIKSGGLTWSNEDAARRFQAEVAPSRELAYLKLAAGDSLRLPAHTRGRMVLHAYDAAGRRLDSLVDAEGEIRWEADSALSLKLDRRSKRALTWQSAAPTALFAKRSALGKGTSARRAAIGDWDTLRVTVALAGIEKSLSLPTKVVDAVINKLVLTSTLGEIDRIPAPASFGLFVAGFDTTTTPPVPLVPDPVLTLDPPQAGSISEMRATLHPDFIGPLRVLARQVNADGSEAATELGAARDSSLRGLNVGQTLRPGDTARLLFHDPRFELAVPDTAIQGSAQAVLRVFKRGVAKSFSSGLDYAVAGPLWEISNPNGAVLPRGPRVILGLPGDGREHELKRFDALKLDWKDPADSASADTNSFGRPALSAVADTLDGNYYALLGASKALTAGRVQVVPNPFSPLVLASRDGNTEYGARIRIHPESDRSAEVTVSAKIYTLDGELLRTLVDHKTVPKGPVDFYWDGKADGGRWARNGRYLLKVAVNATGTSAVRYTLKPIVVFR